MQKFGLWMALANLMAASTQMAQAQGPMDAAEAALWRQAEAIRPSEADLRWQQLPWEIDLDEAIRLAKKEQRPIFFWAAGGRDRDGLALERC